VDADRNCESIWHSWTREHVNAFAVFGNLGFRSLNLNTNDPRKFSAIDDDRNHDEDNFECERRRRVRLDSLEMESQ